MRERSRKRQLMHVSWASAVLIAVVTHLLGLWCLQDLPIPGQSQMRSIAFAPELEELELALEEWEIVEDAISTLVSNEVQVMESSTTEQSASFERMALAMMEQMPNEIPSFQVEPAKLSGSIPTQVCSIDYEPEIHQAAVESWQFNQVEGEFMALAQMEDLLPVELSEPELEVNPGTAVLASTQHFDLDVEYTPLDSGQGYAFRVRFLPVSGVELKEIRQNVTFLFDRSHSIEKARFEATRQALVRVVEGLEPQVHFNIVMFDKRVYPFVSQPVPATATNIASAKAFLSSQKAGGIGASTDLYQSLVDIVPKVVEAKEVNTVILLSDGDTYLREHQQRRAIARWLDENEGKVTLFSVAAGAENNIPMLGLLSSFNKGQLIWTAEYGGMYDSLAKIVRKISHPVGKEIVASAVTTDGGVEIYPRASRLPDLYGGVPYELVGTTQNLDEFYLFLQGKYYDRWLDIKHKISFENARQAKGGLAAALARQKAYDHYDAYLAEGKRFHLHRARELLSPYKIQMAFR